MLQYLNLKSLLIARKIGRIYLAGVAYDFCLDLLAQTLRADSKDVFRRRVAKVNSETKLNLDALVLERSIPFEIIEDLTDKKAA